MRFKMLPLLDFRTVSVTAASVGVKVTSAPDVGPIGRTQRQTTGPWRLTQWMRADNAVRPSPHCRITPPALWGACIIPGRIFGYLSVTAELPAFARLPPPSRAVPASGDVCSASRRVARATVMTRARRLHSRRSMPGTLGRARMLGPPLDTLLGLDDCRGDTPCDP